MSAIVKNELYEARKVDAVYQNILANQKSGKDQFYEIRVDEFPVVGKTNDLESFMNYADFITPETKYISVLLFKGNGQSDKYFFHLQADSFQRAQQLSGLDKGRFSALTENEMRDKIEKDLHYEQLLQENEELKRELADNDKQFIAMQEELDKVKSNRDLSFEGIGSLLLQGAIKSDFVKNAFPLLGQLNGTAAKETPTSNETDESASFKRKGVQDTEEQFQGISEQEKGYIIFIEDIRRRLGDVELANVMHLLDLMASNPASINFALKQVSAFLKNKPKE